MNNNSTIFMEAQKLAKEGKIKYTGRTVTVNVNGMDIEYKETEAIHTFLEWKNAGYMVKKGEKAIARFAIWNYTEKANKAKKAALQAAGDDPNKKMPHFYMKESSFFSMSQVKKLDDPEAKAPEVKIPEVTPEKVTIPVKKSDLAILKRILKDDPRGLVGHIVKDGIAYIMSQHYGVMDTENEYPDLPASESTFDPSRAFKDTEKALTDGYVVKLDLDDLKAFKKENPAGRGYVKCKIPYIVKIVDGKKELYAGFNPGFLIDVLTFTRTDQIKISKDGFNKFKAYNSPAFIDNGSRKGIVLPVFLNGNQDAVKNNVRTTAKF